jgi:Cu(I)/Ag(I) efflux system periplasmic protein CusF
MTKKMFASLAVALLAGATSAQTPQSSGEVTKLDKANNRVTLRHGEIKNLDMPPMTMNFRVRDSKVLDAVAVGDRVRFTAEKIDGSYVLTTLNKAE